MCIQQEVSLQAYNGMAIPVTARALAEITNVEQLRAGVRYAKQHNMPVLVLGEGSNTVFAKDYDGLVLVNRIHGIELLHEDTESVTLEVGAGENWHQLVSHSVAQGWCGLENLALIPGTAGAAPVQNIGAYGVELKDHLVSLDYFDLAADEIRTLRNSECHFDYRDSCFKSSLADKTAITAIRLKLSKRAKVNIHYPALAERFDKTPSPRQVFDAVCEIRRAKLPLPSDIPNTGSFFKNPIVSADKHAKLLNDFPGLVSFPVPEGFKLAAAWMIEQAGWKRKTIKGIGVHGMQALVIVNPERRDGRAVLAFASAIQADIQKNFDIKLQIEPRVY